MSKRRNLLWGRGLSLDAEVTVIVVMNLSRKGIIVDWLLQFVLNFYDFDWGQAVTASSFVSKNTMT